MTKIEKSFFGTAGNGEKVSLFTLENKNGMKVKIIEFGATIIDIQYPDKTGNLCSMTLGSDELSYYENPCGYMGATVGRHANRIENAGFTLNGQYYSLYKNDGENHLHGGLHGFNSKVFAGEAASDGVSFSCVSADGEENYPGKLTLKVTFSLSGNDTLSIHYKAVSDQDTVANLTNHSYFNISGHPDGPVTDQLLKLYADSYTELGSNGVPDGKISPVAGTPFDFREFTPVGKAIDTDHPQIIQGNGYDHNFVLNDSSRNLHPAAELYSHRSGVLLKTYTTMPGIQLYTANYLSGALTGREGIAYPRRSAVCLETQYFPNAMRHLHFPSVVLKAGERYDHVTAYQFSIQNA